MTRKPFWTLVAAGLLTLVGQSPQAQAQDVSVLTHHNNNARTGAQLNETILTPANIKALGLHLRGSGAINGYVYAQPLYVTAVPFAGGASNAVYVVDTTNTVYAFSPAENGRHQLNLIRSRPLEAATNGSTVDPVGIMGTPVVDKARNIIYLVVRAVDNTPAPAPYTNLGNAKFILHALDLATLDDRFTPVVVTEQLAVPGGSATFVPIVERQRTALLLNQAGGRSFVSFGFGSMPGASPSEGAALQHGWAFTYDVTGQPALANVYLSTRIPDSTPPSPLGPGGIWQGGAGFATDSSGNVFVATGNSPGDANNDGDSIVRLTSAGAKFWSAAVPNAAFLNAHDFDLSSAGPIVLPHNSGASRVFAIAKDGSASLLRVYDDIVNNPAFICPTKALPGCSLTFQAVTPGGDDAYWENPVYWNGNVFYVGTQGAFLSSLQWDPAQGVFNSITPTQVSNSALPACGHIGLSLSANGNSNPILWAAVEGDSPCQGGELVAYDATKTNNGPIWSFPSTGTNVPSIHLSRFPMPTIAGNRVFIATTAAPFKGPSELLSFALGGE
jgi:hypothetical protein